MTVDSQELRNRRAVVTGSSSGIGKSIALELARAGASVLIHACSNKAAAQDTAAACREEGVEAPVVLADLSTDSGRTEMMATSWKLFPQVDIWVNNAGADVLTGSAQDLPFQEKLDLLWRVDVLSTIFLSRACADRMKSNDGGVILNMGWDQAFTGMEGDSGEYFAATKGAIMSFTRSFARSVAPEVRVNCLAPGWIRTAWGETASEEWQSRVHREVPLNRWGSPEDVARVARFLASPAAEFVTGQIIPINGGAT